MNKILYDICEATIETSPYNNLPMTVSRLAKINGLTKYAVRKQLKKLKEQGLIYYTSVGDINEDDGSVWCVNGYFSTKKAEDTEEWNKAVEKDIQMLAEIWNFNISKDCYRSKEE